jgi:uncharacterized protein YggE
MSMTVTVQGAGTAKARPDRAVLAFELGHIAATASEALRDIADRTSALEDLLRERGLRDTDWTSAGVTVQPAHEWRKDERVLLGQRATNRLQVTTEDLALVGRLLTDAVERVKARVGGPLWVVERSNAAHAEACRAAAADARQRAMAYAEGLGLELGPVVSADETHREHTAPARGRVMMAQAAIADDLDESAPIAVNAGEMDVTAEVVMTFSLVTRD